MNRIVASAQISLMDYNDAIVTGSMPDNPEKDMLWLNTSVNPHIMKQYTGSEWIIVGELDPEYTEKLEVITGNITDLELTLGNMADDGKLDYGDRQEIVDKLLPIIGYLPENTSVTLKTVTQLDADKKGSFYQLRQSAQNAGIVTSSTVYTGLASAWNALRAYLGGLQPKPWDLSIANQDAVAQVDKGTFRTYWLNYYNAEYTLATATTQILHSAISTINTTTLPAMRDSALSSAEKTAIKQSLIILSSEKIAMDGEIIGLKANPKLENQTPLNEAKSAYDTSYTGVTTAINAVLAVPTGTLIPSTLILGVENAVSSYSAKLSLLKKAMQDTQTAIAEKVSDDASKELSDSLKGYVDKITYGQDIEEIQNQVDGAIMTWFGDNEPTLLTAPAKDWNTTALKDVHLGDLYYDNISGYGYRFGKEGTLYRWIRIVDADVVAALAAAQSAQDTADGKRRAFYNQPTPPYDIGDLWVQGANGELMRAIITKPKGGLYHENDWVKATKYTDDTIAKEAATSASNAQSAANKAQEDATKANNAVSDIISDNKMTPDEKVILQREWLNIQYERNEILLQAERYVIDNASYRSVYDTLNGYLAPFFTNLTTTQDVNGETLRSNFQRYYEQRQAILDAISVAAQQNVLDLQTQVDAGPFADKTSVLSGTEIFTDKADDSVVHVEIDGKSYQHVDKFNLFDIQGWLSIPDSEKPVSTDVPYIDIELKPNAKYTVSTNIPSRGSLYDVFSMASNSSASSGVNGVSINLTRTTQTLNDGILRIAMRNYSLDKNSDYWIKVEEGNITTPFVGYSSPTSDYPIEINSLNDFDLVSQKSEGRTIDGIEIGGRNYWAIAKKPWHSYLTHQGDGVFTNSTVTTSYAIFRMDKLEVPVGGTYTISFEINVSDNAIQFLDDKFYINGEAPNATHNIPALVKDKWVKVFATLNYTVENTRLVHIYIDGISAINTFQIRNFQLEKGNKATDWTPAPEDITENYNHPLINKTNILLSEPLRSVGDVKDRLFRDNDGLWKIERNTGELTLNGSQTWTSRSGEGGTTNVNWYQTSIPSVTNFVSGRAISSHFARITTGFEDFPHIRFHGQGHLSLLGVFPPIGMHSSTTEFRNWITENPITLHYELANSSIEVLEKELQDKLNNIASYKSSNYLYTIAGKTNILPEYVRENLKPNLKAIFKSQTWYQNYKRGNDLRHFIEVKGLDRAIRFGMLVDYQSFAMPTANWLYFCKIKTSTDDFREELVDEDGSIFDYTTQREIKVPKQALDLRGVAEGTTGYLAFDTRNELMWFIHYQRNYTYTTNQETGIIEKIPSSEYWVKWNPGKTGHNTQLALDESVYIVGEIER